MRRIFLLFLFTLSACAPLYSQQEAQAPSETPPIASERLVTAIEVRGNKSISTNTVVSKMKTRIGSPYQENIISDDLKRLYLLGFFSDIKIDSEEFKSGVKVIVSVVERPIIEKITFSGFRRIVMSEEKFKELLKSKESQYLDYPSLAEDVRALKGLCEKKGFMQAEASYKVDINKETNKAKVEFAVSEGGKVYIKDMIVEGNSAFSSTRILRLIKTKRKWLFNPGVLKDEVLKEDMERIKSFYHKNGFTDAELENEVRPDAKRPHILFIHIMIKEGKKYLVGSVTVSGNKDIPEKDVLAVLKECIPGNVFSQEALKIDVANIQSLYFDKGYISAQVQEATAVNSYTGRVDISYNIQEHEIVYVNKIKIIGNIKTRDVVVRRELRIKPGERFDGEKLRRSKERLQNLGFFEEVSYDTEDTSEPDKKDLLVDVKETKTGTFSFGGGYSTVDQLVGFVEIEQKNFDWKNFPYFTGAGQDLRFRASVGSISSGFDLGFTNPWVFDYPVSFGFDAYKRSHSRDEDVGYGYDEDVTGGDLRLGKELSEYLRGDLSYRLDRIEISNILDNATNDLKQEVGKNTISSIIPAFTFDSRDNVFYARKGDLLNTSFEWAGGALGGDKDFWKLYLRGSHYIPMPRQAAIELRARVGLAEAYGDSQRVPIYERFFAGGAYTVRGYEERALGPIDPVTKDPLGGESLMVFNAEYTYPLLSFLKAAVFYDAGDIWEERKDIGSGSLKSSFGLGVRLKTPIGPIMLDYGIPLDKAPGEDSKGSGKFHFSASHGF